MVEPVGLKCIAPWGQTHTSTTHIPADAPVYSSDGPCGHHGGARPSWRGAAIMAGNAVIMAGRGHHGGARSSWRGPVITDSPSAQPEALLVGEEREPLVAVRHPMPALPLQEAYSIVQGDYRRLNSVCLPFYVAGVLATHTNVLSLLTTHIFPATITYGFAAKNLIKKYVSKSWREVLWHNP